MLNQVQHDISFLSFKTLRFSVRMKILANTYISKNAKISIAFFDKTRKVLDTKKKRKSAVYKPVRGT